jgi:hypothetical protein
MIYADLHDNKKLIGWIFRQKDYLNFIISNIDKLFNGDQFRYGTYLWVQTLYNFVFAHRRWFNKIVSYKNAIIGLINSMVIHDPENRDLYELYIKNLQ